jgi:nucleotidyltransferase/DNA polymerase involved in DNA repair
VKPHEPARDQAALLELRAALDPLSPRIALLTTSPDVAFAVDCGRLRTSEFQSIAEMIARRVAGHVRLIPTVGIAASRTVAHLAAQIAPSSVPVVVPTGTEATWLAPYPVELLPIDPVFVTRLHQFGLRTIGAVAKLACDALEAQFGRAGRELFDLVHGRDPLPLAASSATPPLVIGRRFAGPVADTRVLDAALAQIAARLASRLLRHGHAVRYLDLALTLEAGPPIATHRALAEPTADPARLQALLYAMARELDPQEACEELRVTVELAAVVVTQRDLFAPETTNTRQLEATLARLAIKHGGRLLQVTLTDPDARCLEQRIRFTPREDA